MRQRYSPRGGWRSPFGATEDRNRKTDPNAVVDGAVAVALRATEDHNYALAVWMDTHQQVAVALRGIEDRNALAA
ncbi:MULTISPECIES: hypothetical protein [Streptomyces albovinaceus subgroup]|uniref:hypothetical protein n=1 Tax=Streptomyces albovinaceus subgroup TaxID=1482558 RepID=UPI0004C785C8|nr:hypothetical protein [Streptomyces mediolani]